MKIFEEDPLNIPPVRVTPLEDDAEGRALLDRLDALEEQKESAQAEAREAGRPLADLLAEADELAALALVGDADPEEADAAEKEAQRRRERIEEARRQVKQCERAASLVRGKIEDRAQALYAENADAVRDVHRVLVREALQAERRAALLLRVLREFETHYARYTAGNDPEPHPQYLKEYERTSPPRPLMGPARTPGGNVFDGSEATRWMRRAADAIDADPPAVVDVASLDFASEDATPSTVALDPPEDAAPNEAPDPASQSLSPDAPQDAGAQGDDVDAIDAETDEAESGEAETDAEAAAADASEDTGPDGREVEAAEESAGAVDAATEAASGSGEDVDGEEGVEETEAGDEDETP